MLQLISRRDDCRMCGGSELELVVQLTPTPMAHNYVPEERLQEAQPVYPLDLYLCHGCGYTGMLDVVAKEALWDDSRELTSVSLGVAEDLSQQAEAVLARTSTSKDSLVVDIGSNDGTLLNFFHKRGMRVLGVEPGNHAADTAEASGIPTVRDYFSREVAGHIRKEWGPAKIITANRVFANIDNLADMIEGVGHLLEPDGVFVFETGYLVDILEAGLFETIYHEHLGYDSVKPLVAFFRRHGMELINAERISIKGGSLRCAVQLIGGPGTVSPSVASLISLEESKGISSRVPFDAFSKNLNSVKKDLSQLLSSLTAKGMAIAGYGAAQPSTTMIFHLNLGEILGFVVDDDSKNHNQFSPGCHIPILAPQAIYEQGPEYVLILAWRYAEQIMKKHQKYLDQGGHFIVPLPKVEVV